MPMSRDKEKRLKKPTGVYVPNLINSLFKAILAMLIGYNLPEAVV
ncbi:hypothetical protein SPLC1_S130730 [Arthrospira platensis C1]|nr:hypothetical protein SPLC1_S130730 [Arthrospira platensis C1]